MGYKVINRLTVLASETFEDFAKELQKEIEQDTGEKFEGRIKKARRTRSKSL
jgi:type III restriction enzyme